MLTIIHPCQYTSDSHLHIHPVVPALVAPLTLKGTELRQGVGNESDEGSPAEFTA